MAVIWPERNPPVRMAGVLAAGLFLQQGRHHRDHVDVAAEVIRFHEGAVGSLADIAQMREADVRRKALRHRWYVVLVARTERAGAEGDAVGDRRTGVDNELQIVRRRHDAWQAE